MKLQFSLATMLVCVTMLAGDLALATAIPVKETIFICFTPDANPRPGDDKQTYSRPPTDGEIVSRLLIVLPLSIAPPLCALWLIRRLKSRGENGQPVD